MYNIPMATNIATAEALILALDRGDLDGVKCTNKLKKTAGVSGLILASFLLFGGCASSPTAYTEAYEAGQYTKDLYRGTLFAERLCVAAEDVALDGYTEDPTFHAAGLFDLKKKKSFMQTGSMTDFIRRVQPSL